jgi:DNA polymerase-3 subunit epsilon
MLYSIVDIETTGGHASGNRIIEIAIYKFDGENIIDHFHSLINPQVRIPGFITSLTGITEEMIYSAPSFHEIADEILKFTEGTIFVAHNVNFDFTFLKKEFDLIDQKFDRPKLCTIRASRKIFPKFPSYSLGNLCGSLGISIKERHRASGDAEATVQLLKLLLENDHEQFIQKSLKKNSRETLLPAHLPREQFDALPEEAGVYYFHNQKGKVIYVGKAINIKKRVISHFSGKQKSKQSQNFMREIHGVSFELCGNELIALLLESYEIKKYWPAYNRSQKKTHQNFGLYQYEDMEGYLRISVGNVQKHQQPLLYFRYISDAREFLIEKTQEFNLCPKLCGLQKAPGYCLDYHMGICKGACIKKELPDEYNKKVLSTIASFEDSGKSYVIKGEGRKKGEYSVVLVEKGKYLGFGFIPKEYSIYGIEELKEFVNGHWDNQDIQKILESYLRANDESSVYYFTEEVTIGEQ